MKLDFLAVVSLAELMLGNSVEAERLLLRVLETNPNNFGLTNNLIWALARSKEKEKLERAYQLAESNLRKNPLSIEAVATLAWTQLRLGKVSEATETLERPTSNRNLSRDAAYFLAKTKEAEGKAEESKKILDGAIRARGEFFHLKAANADFERLSQ
jgi:tetratricopeptide (TPR) repeat protein